VVEYTIKVESENDIYNRYFRLLDKDRNVLAQSVIVSHQQNILRLGYSESEGKWYLIDIYDIKSFFKDVPVYFHICCGESYWWRVNDRLVLNCMEYNLSEYISYPPVSEEPEEEKPVTDIVSDFFARYWYIFVVLAVIIAVVIVLLVV